MTEKIIQKKSTSQYPNLIYSPDLALATINDLTVLHDGSDIALPTNFDTPAQGTIVMTGVSVEDETFAIGDGTFTWKATRTVAFTVAIGASAAEACTNLITAINADFTIGVYAVAGSGTTVICTSYHGGPDGNSVIFSEASTNMSMDGGGHLGGTTIGASSLEELAHIDITGQGYDAILTASEFFYYDWTLSAGDQIIIQVWIELYDNTTDTSVVSFNLACVWLYNVGGIVFTGWAFEPYIHTVQTLIDGHSYTWKILWGKVLNTWGGGSSALIGLAQDRTLTIQEIKR